MKISDATSEIFIQYKWHPHSISMTPRQWLILAFCCFFNRYTSKNLHLSI